MRQIRPEELKAWLEDESKEPPLLLDVRQPWEAECCRIEGAQLIPMALLPARYAELDPEREIVVICHHGVRSYHAARFLEHNGYARVTNLTGGVDAWAKDVDPTMSTY
jgi:rhodanese-related sulfurtransferase